MNAGGIAGAGGGVGGAGGMLVAGGGGEGPGEGVHSGHPAQRQCQHLPLRMCIVQVLRFHFVSQRRSRSQMVGLLGRGDGGGGGGKGMGVTGGCGGVAGGTGVNGSGGGSGWHGTQSQQLKRQSPSSIGSTSGKRPPFLSPLEFVAYRCLQ